MTDDLTLGPDGGPATITLDESEGDIIATGDVTGASAEFAGDVQMASQNGGQLAGFRNQIINGDFGIWQRGDSFANSASDQYTADRWFTGQNNGAVTKVTGAGANLDFFNSLQISHNNGAIWVGQPVELPGVGAPGQFAVGTTWTGSFWGKTLSGTSNVNLSSYFADRPNGSGAVGIQLSPDFTLTTSWQRFEWTFTINAAPGPANTLFNFIIGSTTVTNTCRFAGVQLEPGPVATPFEHRPIGTELALCQRYYQIIEELSARHSTPGNIATSTSLLTEMRVAPTVASFYENVGTGFNFYSAPASLVLIVDASNPDGRIGATAINLDAEL